MYDIIILGGGPGGYVAAERAGQMGKKVLLIEKETLGGVCLNHGCVPTKSLLHSAKLFKNAQFSRQFGVEAEQVSFKFDQAMEWKNTVVSTMVHGVDFLMKGHNVDVLYEEGTLLPDNTVQAGEKIYKAGFIIIATGSSPSVPPIPGIDSSSVITSRELLQIQKLPASLTIIGGGVIGMEFASLFSTVGVKVSVIEMLPEVLPMMEDRMARIVRTEMKDTDFYLNAKVDRIEGNTVFYSREESEASVASDLILIAAGRKANTGSLQKINLAYRKGFLSVNEKMETNIPGIYAIGDVTGKSMLAHSASRMGEVAVNVICGKTDRMRYHAIPWAVYTLPEAAGCGFTEKEARERGIDVRSGIFQMKNNSRYFAEYGKGRGMCKIVIDAGTGSIIGIHLVGGISSELIAGAAGIIEAELRIEEVKQIVYPHPSLSEVIRDAVWSLT